MPVIGDKLIQELTAEDIAEIAKPIWDKPATVERCLGSSGKFSTGQKLRDIARRTTQQTETEY